MNEIEYTFYDENAYPYYEGPHFPFIQRCLSPGTYFLEVYKDQGWDQEYSLLIEEEKDPPVKAEAGAGECFTHAGKDTEVRLDGSGTSSYSYREEPGSQPFIDITTTGEKFLLNTQGLVAFHKVLIFPDDFSFRFYGSKRKRVVASADGYLAFGIKWNCYVPPPIPSPEEPNDIIAPFWGSKFLMSKNGAAYY